MQILSKTSDTINTKLRIHWYYVQICHPCRLPAAITFCLGLAEGIRLGRCKRPNNPPLGRV